MKKKNNKECIVCSTRYTYCPTCTAYASIPRWKNIYHDENCRNIYNIASEYAHGMIDKDEAKTRFNNCDLSNKESFKEFYVSVINEVFAEVKKTVIETKEDKEAKANKEDKVEVLDVLEAEEVVENPSKKHVKKD